MAKQPKMLANDQAYGERQANDAAQSAIPLEQQQPPEVASGVRRLDKLRGGEASPDQAWMFERPSDYPDEPVTAGSPSGPGPGPEVLPTYQPQGPREQILAYLAEQRGNADAKAYLDGLRSPAPVPSQVGGLEPLPPEGP